MPGTYDLKLYRGDSDAWRFTLFLDDAATLPDDLTGAVVAAEIRDKSAGAVVVDLNVVVTLPNIVDMAIDPDMYTDCPAKGVWDLQVTYSTGRVYTPLAGSVTVTPDVTDSAPLAGRVWQ